MDDEHGAAGGTQMSKQASDRAYEHIRAEVLRRRWPAGTWLREDEIAAEVGVSRTPVREALRRIAGDGLVEHVPNRGVQVLSISEQDVMDLTSVRALVEAHAASVAAVRISASELETLRDVCERMDAVARADPIDLVLIAELNERFHDGVLEAARSRYLSHMLSQVRRPTIATRTFAHYTPDEIRRSARQHIDVLAALEARDGEWARSVMHAHLLTARLGLMRGVAAAQAERQSQQSDQSRQSDQSDPSERPELSEPPEQLSEQFEKEQS
jgi:DNA-binding GntR family transcriptional regulator